MYDDDFRIQILLVIQKSNVPWRIKPDRGVIKQADWDEFSLIMLETHPDNQKVQTEEKDKMGTWGPGLYQNDVSDDIKLGFKDKCKRGHTIEEATEIFIKEYSEELKDEDDAPNFWFALADIQWKYGKLLPKVKENALKNETYSEFDKSDAKKRKKVLEGLWEKLNSPMPPEKKISQYRLYQCEWEIGDTYAYPLDAEIWKDNKYYGDYLIMQKIGERDWWPGHIVPVVRIKITENKQLPTSAEEIEKLKYIILEERSPNKRYTLGLGNTSKRIIPKKLTYMGKYDLFPIPDDAEQIDLKDMYTYSEWKYFDECIFYVVKRNWFSDV